VAELIAGASEKWIQRFPGIDRALVESAVRNFAMKTCHKSCLAFHYAGKLIEKQPGRFIAAGR
jgi:hypothetical protein